jgi:hypothetical protein
MSVKQRWPQLRYVPRTHRINLDWIFELVSNDPGVFIKWISTKEQLADILTKGMFTAAQFQSLVEGAMIGPKFEKSGANLVSNEVSRCCYAECNTSFKVHHTRFDTQKMVHKFCTSTVEARQSSDCRDVQCRGSYVCGVPAGCQLWIYNLVARDLLTTRIILNVLSGRSPTNQLFNH